MTTDAFQGLSDDPDVIESVARGLAKVAWEYALTGGIRPLGVGWEHDPDRPAGPGDERCWRRPRPTPGVEEAWEAGFNEGQDLALAPIKDLHLRVINDLDPLARCSSCVAGYNPKTGDLVMAAWPCQTAQAWGER